MKIAGVELKNNLFLAPMAGFTDIPFRLICKREGAGLVFTEMISASGLYYGNENTRKLLEIEEEELPCAVQIFGRDPYIMAKAAEKINESKALILDINMGCPMPKIVKNGEGAALLLEPELARKIVKAVISVSLKPVTVKIRKGWDEKTVNAIEIAKMMEELGVKAITIHGRTREQLYGGKADWDIIKKVKESVSIPVIGNGDVFSPEDAKRMMEYTNCDAVMIGRGALGNPWIFRRTEVFLETDVIIPEPNAKDKILKAIEHLRLSVKYKGEYIGVREMRQHLAYYIKGFKNSAYLRDVINRIEAPEELEAILLKSLENL